MLIPAGLALVYIVLLITRLPRLTAWQRGDSDIAAAFTLAEAIAHGHTGHVILSTQGSWVPLAYGLLTAGLGVHRVLWEISPLLLSLATFGLIAWTVARVAGRAAGVLSLAVLIAMSPTALAGASAAFSHNTTLIGTALLDAFLVWRHGRVRRRAVVTAAVIGLSVVIGVLLASDELLLVDGLAPFVAVSVLLAWRRGDRRGLGEAFGITAGALAVSIITTRFTGALGLSTTTAGVRLRPEMIGEHLRWLAEGLLRLGGGLRIVPGATPPGVLVATAGAVTVVAVATTLIIAVSSLRRPVASERGVARALHAGFWAGSLLAISAAYVFTNAAVVPTDRYLLGAMPAVAAVVPLAAAGRRRWIASAGAAVIALAAIVALAGDAERPLIHHSPALGALAQIERVVAAEHLGVGYAGYWDAAALSWSSHGRLSVYPITDTSGRTAPMDLAQVAAWYVPRPATSSYVVLVPGDSDLADRLPPGLPRPVRVIRFGAVWLAVYRRDVARYLVPVGA